MIANETRIKIVNYGAPLWSKIEIKGFPILNKNEETGMLTLDMHPELVGKTGKIDNGTTTQGRNSYAIQFDDGKWQAWFSENQIQIINEE